MAAMSAASGQSLSEAPRGSIWRMGEVRPRQMHPFSVVPAAPACLLQGALVSPQMVHNEQAEKALPVVQSIFRLQFLELSYLPKNNYPFALGKGCEKHTRQPYEKSPQNML